MGFGFPAKSGRARQLGEHPLREPQKQLAAD
jgi:hypothetical protein